MSSANTFEGFYNLPSVTAASTSEFLYKVPASGAYPSLPSPTQVAANALVLPLQPGDVTGGVVDNARPFRIRVGGTCKSNQSENITVKIYQCTAAAFSAGFTATNATGVTAIATTGTMATGAALTFDFYLEYIGIFSTTSLTLTGYYQGVSSKGTPATIGPTIQTNALTALAGLKDLNFAFSLTAGTNTTADVFSNIDFVADRY